MMTAVMKKCMVFKVGTAIQIGTAIETGTVIVTSTMNKMSTAIETSTAMTADNHAHQLGIHLKEINSMGHRNIKGHTPKQTMREP